MEAFVLIPEEFSLEFASGTGNNLRVVSNQSFIPRGSRFSPFQGTLRTDEKLRHSNYFRDDPNSKGNLKKYSSWGGVRATSWIRFLKKSVQITRDVNLVEVVLPGGQVIYEVRRPISLWEELIVFSTEPPLTFTKALTDAMFDETLKALLLEVPLDLSTSLFHKVPNSSDGESDESCISPNLSIENLSTKSSSSSSSTAKRTRSLLPCSVCAKAFDRPSLLKRHMRTHTGEKPHECDICGKGFSTSSSLNTHRRIHSGEKPHECPTCGKRFTASSNLYYHRMTHVKEKPHKCSICNKSFPTPGDLKSHGYVHSGTWPFRCPVCKRGFSKHTNLKNHLFLHTGSKPHACTVCNKRFALACNLRAHLKTHHEDHDDTDPMRSNCLVEDEDSEEMITNISLDEEDCCEQDPEEVMQMVGGLSSP